MDMKRKLSSADAPKLAAAGFLLLIMLGGVFTFRNRHEAQQENWRANRQMKLEMGLDPNTDSSEPPEEQPGAGDPNFVW